jgi:hypothetical protein
MTGGRTRAQRRDLRIETLLQTKAGHIPALLPEEQQLVLEQCTRAVSVAEVAVNGVVKIDIAESRDAHQFHFIQFVVPVQ